MSKHPNRGRAPGPIANPTPDAIRAAREAACLTQREAGALVYSERIWESWEAGRQRMHPGLWELFKMKCLETEKMNKQPYAFENWVFSGDRIHGNIYNCPHLEDGQWASTERLIRIDVESGRAFSANNVYSLGEPLNEPA